MNFIRSLLLLLLALATAGTLSAQSDWDEPFPPHRIADHLYYVGSKGLATYLVTTSKGHILINSSFDRTVPIIRANIEKLGFKFTDVKILLASHAHSDHVAGHALIKELTGARVEVMTGDNQVIASGGKGQYLYQEGWKACAVDRVLKDGDTVTLGEATLTARHTPGHTRGCTTWTMQATDGGKQWNVVIIGSPNVNPGYQLITNRDYPEIADDFANTFRRLKSLPCDIFLGAHGNYYGMEEKFSRLEKDSKANPFIDPEGYRAYVENRYQAFREKSEPAKITPVPSLAPTVLPGRGLAEHDFFYAGEAKDRRMFIVRQGKVVWSYDDPAGRGEISDAILLSNSNVLLAHQFAVKLVGPDKKVIWNYEAPAGCEIHTAQMIGKEHVLFVQNGNPALVKVINIVTGETKKEFPLPVRNPQGVHGQFRHARLTSAGTLLVAHMDNDKVCEYNAEGKELWSLPAARPWGVTPLRNGNLLITESRGIREVTRRGETVWEFLKADAPDYQLANLQLAWRLPNGNTLINVWFNEWSGKLDRSNPPVQALEVTPDKKIVWALRSWEEPNLGPATTVQILDQPDAPENVTFGDFK